MYPVKTEVKTEVNTENVKLKKMSKTGQDYGEK